MASNIVVVRPGLSPSADALVQALQAAGHNAVRNNPPADSRGQANWVSVGWGRSGCDINTEAGKFDKYEELLTLAHHGVPCPETRQTPPSAEIRAGVWLGRTPNHKRARDLRMPRMTRREGLVTYYTRKLDVVEEYRVHVFRNHRAGKENTPEEFLVCRSGIKVPVQPDRSGEATLTASTVSTESPESPESPNSPHPWIRSRMSGWNISYDNFSSGSQLRNVAKQAVKALGLDFGAVDLGKCRDGSLVVFEVNTAPALDNPNTAVVYATRLALLAGAACRTRG